MIQLNVWLTLKSHNSQLVGQLIAAEPDFRGELKGQFRYSPSYLDSESAFPLDPVHLPLTPELFDANRPASGVHGVFEDSLPDDWGRRLLARRHNLLRNEQRAPQLLSLLGGAGMGALHYSESAIAPLESEGVVGRHLGDLQRLARMFELDYASIEDDLSLLFQAGSSPGGARPKALLQDQGKAWLVKFNSIKDRFDVVALEAAAMQLARNGGVKTAYSKLVPCGTRKALFVERFDLNWETGKRRHVVSMMTLLGASGYYYLGYRDMADIIRKVSSNPANDLQNLFRQLVFNVLIGNTDDHLKNFCMLCDGHSWYLSPAFDLVPNVGQNSEHVLRIGTSTSVPNRNTLLQEAKYFGIKQQKKAVQIIDSIIGAVSDWETIFHESGVPATDIKIIGRDIQNRLSSIVK